MNPEPQRSAEHTEPDVDLVTDLNAQDDDGHGWSTLEDAADASRVTPGAMLLAGNHSGQAVVRVLAIDDDGQVHFAIEIGDKSPSKSGI